MFSALVSGVEKRSGGENDSPSLLDMDLFHYLVSVCMSLPTLYSDSEQDSEDTSANAATSSTTDATTPAPAPSKATSSTSLASATSVTAANLTALTRDIASSVRQAASAITPSSDSSSKKLARIPCGGLNDLHVLTWVYTAHVVQVMLAADFESQGEQKSISWRSFFRQCQ